MYRHILVPLVAVVACSCALVGCNSSSNSGGAKSLTAGGATFVDPIMQEWTYAYKQAKGVEVDYQAKGSGNGLQQMTAKNYHFGCSDAPMKKSQLDEAIKNGGEVIHIPLIMGPVVPAYNVPGLDKPLVFSGDVLAQIYMGHIKTWNHEAIKKLNKDANLPDLKISPVFRAEPSGTTNIFTEFLAKTNKEFKDVVGASTSPKWPIGTGEKENIGVANRVKNSAGSIGYVELSFAKKSGVAYGAVRNRAGNAILGGPESVTAAAEEAMKVKQETEPYMLHELTYSLTDAAGEKSYPISGISYAVIYKKQKADVGKSVKDFLHWATHEGQDKKFTEPNFYASLPAELVKKIEARLNQIEMEP